MIDPVYPTLSLLTIAAMAEQRGHKVEILDMSYSQYDYHIVLDEIKNRKPEIVGITATTPLMNQLRDISVLIKSISRNILVVGGGSHVSALPVESMKESMLDIVVVGEGDITFADIADGYSPETIPGIQYRKADQIIATPPRPFIHNLDNLSMPAWHLYNEFALADDIFTSDPAWAKSVSQAIIKSGIKIAWTCTNGIRVESADNELFTVMRKAGCYRVAFGFETGNDKVLKMFGKGGKATIEKGRDAVRMARAAGIDTNGYFMLGLSPDTEETMLDTIEYARSLSLDMMKFGIAIAFPGTPMFKEYRMKGMIRSYNWDDYFIYSNHPLFSHANLSFEKVQEFSRIAYHRAVLTT